MKNLHIPLDDILDMNDAIEELRDWMETKKETFNPAQMSFLLIYLGSQISISHAHTEQVAIAHILGSMEAAFEEMEKDED